MNWINTSETKTAGKMGGHCCALFPVIQIFHQLTVNGEEKQSKTLLQG